MKNILLKMEDRKFYKLSSLKARLELTRKENITWEEFIMILKEKFERHN